MDMLSFDIASPPIWRNDFVIVRQHESVTKLENDPRYPSQDDKWEILNISNPWTNWEILQAMEYIRWLPGESLRLSPSDRILLAAFDWFNRSKMASPNFRDFHDNSLSDDERKALVSDDHRRAIKEYMDFIERMVRLSVQNQLSNPVANHRLWNLHSDIWGRVAICLQDSVQLDTNAPRYFVRLHDRVNDTTRQVLWTTKLLIQTIEIATKPSEILTFHRIPSRDDIEHALWLD